MVVVWTSEVTAALAPQGFGILYGFIYIGCLKYMPLSIIVIFVGCKTVTWGPLEIVFSFPFGEDT